MTWAGQPPVTPIAAWRLTEGTELPGSVCILLIDRDPARRTIQVLTDEPGAARIPYHADDLVDVVTLVQ